MSAASKKAWADPEVRARMGWLSAGERELVVAEIRKGRPYLEISLDWLVSAGRIAQIASEEGLQRRARKRAPVLAEVAS